MEFLHLHRQLGSFPKCSEIWQEHSDQHRIHLKIKFSYQKSSIFLSFCWIWVFTISFPTKGQLISEWIFGVFKSPKSQIQISKKANQIFGRFDTKISFWDEPTFQNIFLKGWFVCVLSYFSFQKQSDWLKIQGNVWLDL